MSSPCVNIQFNLSWIKASVNCLDDKANHAFIQDKLNLDKFLSFTLSNGFN